METKVIKVCDGIVIIKDCLSVEDQRKLVDIVLKYGNLKNEQGYTNFSKTRGRNYSNLDVYGEESKNYMKILCNTVMKKVIKVDQTIPESDVSHLLTLCYVHKAGMGWHKDDGANDGDFDTPVISFTIGNSCIFEYKINDIVYTQTLESGDLIVFGGPQRMMLHRVKKVNRGTCPDYLTDLDDCRINLTFRQAKSVIGKEEEFSTEKYREEIKEKYPI